MLFYKAWLESCARFLTGIVVLACLSGLHVYLHHILIPQWIVAMQEPLTPKPAWLSLGIHDYRFYIWHFLYDYQLQEIWVLFAILLSFGGLAVEYAKGNFLFSLGLPVSRRRWIQSRFLVATLEAFALAFVPVIVVPITSAFFGLDYDVGQGVVHSVLMAASGIFFIAAGTIVSTLLRMSYYITIAVTLVVIGIPYLFIQEYVREANIHSWLYNLDLSHVMAGPWLISWSNMPWMGVLVSLALSCALLISAIYLSKKASY